MYVHLPSISFRECQDWRAEIKSTTYSPKDPSGGNHRTGPRAYVHVFTQSAQVTNVRWFTGEGVEKAQALAKILYTPNSRSLRSADILPLTLTENGGGGDSAIKKLNWKDVKGMTISKSAVVYGLCRSRGMSQLIPLISPLSFRIQ
jgi:hypothetical protein